MKVLITGGSGMIGRALIASLASSGHQALVLTRNPQSARLPGGAEPVQWDAQSPEGWGHLIDEVEVVVNLAGENLGGLPWTNKRKQTLRSSRVDAGHALVEAIKMSSRRPRVLLQVSGTGYYGTSDEATFTERSEHGSDYLASICVDWEASTQPVETMGVRRVITRLGVVLSTEGGALPRFLYPWKLYVAGPLGSGKQWISWVHIQDVVNGMRFLIEREDAAGAFNLTAPEPVTNETFGHTLAEVMGRPFWAPVPAFALKALYGEMSTTVLDGQRVLSERLPALGFQFTFDRLRPALEDLLKEGSRSFLVDQA